MSSDKLKKLIEHRDAILLAEIGTLIHDVGKLSEEFVKSKCVEESGNWIHHTAIVEYDAHRNITHARKIKQILESIEIKLDGYSIRLYDFVLGHHKKMWSKKESWDKPESFEYDYRKRRYDEDNIFLKFIIASDTFDSDEDKSYSKDPQNICGVYKSTSFGFENELIEMDALIEERKKIYKILIDWLNTCDFNEIIRKRRKCMNEIRKSFSKALGETRRSANDVTLWDHSYMTASIMKALVAYHVLDPSFVVKSKKDIINNKPFKIFAVGWNYFDFIKQSHKIPDVIGRIEILKEIKEEISRVVEEEYALGNSIYDDDFGIYFLIPSIIDENDLEDVKERIFDVFNEKVNGILLPIFHIEPKEFKIDDDFRIGKLLIKAIESIRKEINTHKIEWIRQNDLIKLPWVKSWKSSVQLPKDKLICNVCGKGYYCKGDDEKICDICDKLRKLGRKRDEKEETPQTVFIDEISWNPKTKRYENVCLLIAKFDLNEWLDGKFVQSLFIRKPNKQETEKIENLFWYFYYEDKKITLNSIFTILKKIISLVKQYNIERKEGILKGIKNQLKQLHQNLGNNYNDLKVILLRSGIDENIIDSIVELIKKFDVKNPQNVDLKEYDVEVFLRLDIENRELEGDIFIKGDKANEIVKELFDMDKPSLKPFKLLYKSSNGNLVKFYSLILQKPSSPSRLMRVWNNTKDFLETISELICLKVPIISECKIILEDNINDLTPNMAYFLEIENYSIVGEVICLEETSKELYIITPYTNDFLVKNRSSLEGAKILLRHPDNRNKVVGKGVIEEIKENCRVVRAYRIISTSPTLFMAIIPANISLEIVKRIKEEYIKHFGKVFGKLPLHIGLIYFKRKMPIFAVLDSASRIINGFKTEEQEEKDQNNKNEKGSWICLQVSSDPISEDNYMILELIPTKEEQKSFKYKVKIPYILGDGNPDYYHPYLRVEDSSDDIIELKINEDVIIQKHILKIKKGDKIIVKKYYFDLEFLDSNIRRFDIGEKRKHWLFADSTNKPKPYLLWDIDNFERLRKLIQKLGLTTTQIMNFYEMLMAKLEEWEIRKPPAELLSSEDEKDKEKAKVFENLVENAIKSIPLRLEVVDEESGKDKISKGDFEFLKDSIMSGLFFDFVDLWHTILKKKFEEDEEDGSV